MSVEEVKQLLMNHFMNVTIEVASDDNVHFEAMIVSEQFIGKSRVQQQQQVYGVLNEHIRSGQIHAIALKTMTPEEWENSKWKN